MNWVSQNRLALRLAALAVLIAGLLGPWGYEFIAVPDEYVCTPPYVRVRSNFCGDPLSGIWFISNLGLDFFSVLGAVVSGQRSFQDAGRELLSVLAWLPALPLIGTLLLTLRPASRGLRGFQLAALLLATGVTVLFIPANPDKSDPRLWGPRLFLVGLLAGLIVEWRLAGKMKPQSS